MHFFPVSVYNGFKFCPSSLETVGIRMHTENFRDFPFFIVGSSCKTCPSVYFNLFNFTFGESGLYL
jgi:hypothetical protein